MIEIGRLCMKIAGRDAGKKCVVIELLDKDYVTIDGSTRRRKCNIKHLEPLKTVLKIKQGASHSDISKEFEKLGLKPWSTKPKTVAPRTKKHRKVKEKPIEKKEVKTKAVKEEKKIETTKEQPIKKSNKE